MLVISVNDNFELKRHAVEETGIKIVNGNEYDICADSPDIVVYNNQIDFGKYNNLRDVRMIISMPAVLVNGWILKKRLNDVMTANILGKGQISPDYYLVEKIIYDTFAPEELKNKSWFEFGNPKFDLIYKNVVAAQSVGAGAWKKIEGKKTILWAFDHNWITVSCSFDLYFKHFINWFSHHDEMALIIRPHPSFINEMNNKEIWPRGSEKK